MNRRVGREAVFLAQPPRQCHCDTRSGTRRMAAIVFLATLVAAAAGCQTIGFYAQAAAGQWSLMRTRVPVTDVLRDPSTPAALAQKLDFVGSVLDFAHADLALPRDGRYRSYVNLDRSSVVWNVFATREFSVDPVQWCYPVVGCAAY